MFFSYEHTLRAYVCQNLLSSQRTETNASILSQLWKRLHYLGQAGNSKEKSVFTKKIKLSP